MRRSISDKTLTLAFKECTDSKNIPAPDETWQPSESFVQRTRVLCRAKNSRAVSPWRAAACISVIAMLFTCFALSLAIAAEHRTNGDFCLETDRRGTEVLTIHVEGAPQIIEDVYEPKYIPDGYTKLWSKDNDSEHSLCFAIDGDETRKIRYSQYTESVRFGLNTEDTVLDEITVQGCTGYCLHKWDYVSVFWKKDGYVHFVTTPDTFSIDTVLKVCDSISK